MPKAIQWIALPVLAIAFLVGIDSPKAEAGNGFSLQIGGFGISSGRYDSYRPSYGPTRNPYRYNSYRSTYFGGGYGQTGYGGYRGHGGGYYDTRRFDYRAPSLSPRRSDCGYVPSYWHR